MVFLTGRGTPGGHFAVSGHSRENFTIMASNLYVVIEQPPRSGPFSNRSRKSSLLWKRRDTVVAPSPVAFM